MTDELEAVGAETKRRREIDDSLARFSAVHDELASAETQRRERLGRLTARSAALLEQTKTKLTRAITPVRTPDGSAQDSAYDAESEQAGDEAASPVRTRLQEKKKRRTDRSVRGSQITAAVLAGLVFLVTGLAWGTKTWFNNKFNEIAALEVNSADIRDAAGQAGDQNFLIVGSDTRAGSDQESSTGDADGTPGARADTVMIAHIPADRKRAVVVSFPRDLEVPRPQCAQWDSKTGQYSHTSLPAEDSVKLNSIYAEGGPRCVTKLIQQVSGMRMNHFVGVDFNGFKDMVNAVGGVDVHTDEPVNDSTLGPIIDHAGDARITGDQALNFVRARHVEGDPTSDYGRIKRQQEFLSSLLGKVMSDNVLLDANKLTGFVNAFAAASYGENLGIDQMVTLAQSMQGVSAGKIDFQTVPTTGESNSRGNEVLMRSQASAVFRALIENKPLPQTALQTPAAPAQ